MFTTEIEQTNNNPPWVGPPESPDTFERILESDPCDFSIAWCPKVGRTYKFFRDILSGFPNLRKCVKVVLPGL
jgi:hypothetical protein